MSRCTICQSILAAGLALCLTSNAYGLEIGQNDLRVSNVGPVGDANFDASDPVVAYNSIDEEYLIVWSENHVVGGEFEIHGQRVTLEGLPTGIFNFTISNMANGNPLFGAFQPSVAHNSLRNEYLVAWMGDDFSNGIDDDVEIFVQRLSADGTGIGGDIQISDIGQDPGSIRQGRSPRVVYNPADDEYLVIWFADDPDSGLADEEYEIFGQRLDGQGQEIGANDFRISDMGIDGDSSRGASIPAVAFNSNQPQYLVLWNGDDDAGGQVENEFEIFGQRLDRFGNEIGINDFRISDMGGGLGDASYGAFRPHLAFDQNNDRWLVVWHGDDSSGGLIDDEFEIFGSLLNSAAQEIQSFRISRMGGTGNTGFAAFRPRAAFDPVNSEYLVIWQGDQVTSGTGGPDSDEYEIWAQRISQDGDLIERSVAISDMGPDDSEFDALATAQVINPDKQEFLAVWSGTDDSFGGCSR